MRWCGLFKDIGGFAAYVPDKKPWISSLVSGIGGLASSVMQNIDNSERDEQQFQRQIYLMDKANHYNSAPEQRKRLEDAGINPALAFASGNTGVASSTPSVPQHTPVDYSQFGSGLSNAAAQMIQAKQVDAQTNLTESQAEAQRIENKTLHIRRLEEWRKLKEEAKKAGQETRWIDWQEKRDMALFDAYQKKEYAIIENLKSQTLVNNVQSVLGMDTNSREWQKLEPVLRQLESIARSNDARALLDRRSASIIPRLSSHQLELISDAYVDEKLKDASAEDIAGFRFSGTTIQEIKQAVKSFLKRSMFGD